MKLVHLVSDPLPVSLSVNKRVSGEFLERLGRLRPELSIVEIDLNRDPPPYYDVDLFRFVWQPLSDPGYQPGARELAAAEYMQRQVEGVRDTDLLLLSAPVWNYYLPAVLKAWIDQVLSPGQMFELGDTGRRPLHRIQTLVSIVSAGGWISRQGVGESLTALVQAPFDYAGIEHQHMLLIEGQEPGLYADHLQREGQAIDAAGELAARLADLATG